MEYRIEQLARSAGVAVDTIRFYQGKGLLEAPRRDGRVTWYGEGHMERLRRIRELQQRGFTLTVIQRFLAGELQPSDEALVAAVTHPTSPQTLTLAELAERSGVAAPLLASASRPKAASPRPPSASCSSCSTSSSKRAERWCVTTSSARCSAPHAST